MPIAAGLLVDVFRYIDALTFLRIGDAGPIIRAFTTASRIVAATGTRLVNELVETPDGALTAPDNEKAPTVTTRPGRDG